MKIDSLALGSYQTNCYVVRRDVTARECVIIDPGLEAQPLFDFLKDKALEPVAVILTHGHIDHIAGLRRLRELYADVKVYIHSSDADMLTGAAGNLSVMTGKIFETAGADVLVNDGDVIETACIKLKVLHTPGHTAGGICLYAIEQSLVFVGDTLFADSVGRTDFPGGSMSELVKSIKEKLLTLPEETRCYPGHGPGTTISREKQQNPFLR